MSKANALTRVVIGQLMKMTTWSELKTWGSAGLPIRPHRTISSNRPYHHHNYNYQLIKMSAQAVGRAAAQAGKAASEVAGAQVLKKGANRDPELYVRSDMTLHRQCFCSFGMYMLISLRFSVVSWQWLPELEDTTLVCMSWTVEDARINVSRAKTNLVNLGRARPPCKGRYALARRVEQGRWGKRQLQIPIPPRRRPKEPSKGCS